MVSNPFLSSTDVFCWWGCNQRGKFLHLWWSCPKIKAFWEEMTPWIKKLTLKPIASTPLQLLFHDTSSSVKTFKKSVIPHLLNAAKSLIPYFWKQSTCPSLLDWKREEDNIMEADRWVHSVKNQQNTFKDIWVGRCTTPLRYLILKCLLIWHISTPSISKDH